METRLGLFCSVVWLSLFLSGVDSQDDCGVPPAITNGAVVAPTTLVGDQASYTCNFGFDMVGDAVITCDAGPAWSGGAPDCTQQDCGDPDPLTDGTVDFTTTTTGSSATYACNPGFLQTGGVLTPVCVAGIGNPSWTTGPPTCAIRDCGNPPQQALGTVTFTDTVYLSTATYACNTGHTLVGDTTRTCNDQGAWSGSVPTCNINDCGALTNPTDGAVSTTTTTYQSVATYSCATGYDLTGDTTRTCQANSAWSGTAPTCVIQDCGTPDAVDFATVSGDTTFGSSVTYVCIAGYVYNTGDLVRTCNPGPTWSGTLPACRIQDCGQPQTIANGAFTTPTGTTYNEQAIYTCNNGYNLPGEVATVSVTCNDGPSWSAPPSCTIQDCGNLVAIANGGVTHATTTYQSVATYTCNAGYDLQGGATRTCEHGAAWSGTEPTCAIQDCGAPPTPTNGAVTTPSGTTTFGELATYVCDPGYDLPGQLASLSITCDDGPNWSSAAPPCLIQDCGTPPSTNNGAFTTLAGTTFGDVATYVCDQGYDLPAQVASVDLTCNDGPTWSPTAAPVCTIQDCGNLVAIANGGVTHPTTTYQSVATYNCNAGYDLQGGATRTCDHGATWSGTAPTCLIQDCGAPPSTNNGGFTTPSGTNFGGVARYVCDSGYDLPGEVASQDLTCEDGPTWSSAAPVCTIQDCGSPAALTNGQVTTLTGTTFQEIASYQCNEGYNLTSGDSTVTCQAGKAWSAGAPVCTIVDCDVPSGITNGAVTFPGTTYNEVATYSCDTGYDLQGDATRTCQYGPTWDGALPSCLIHDCGTPDPTTNGNVDFSAGTTYLEIATYTCNPGYDLPDEVASIPIVCQAGKQWNDSAPVCTIQDCGSPAVPTNGQVFTPTGTTFQETANYQCNTGYNLTSGDSSVTCQAGKTWSAGAPVCTIVDCGLPATLTNGGFTTANGRTYNELANYFCNPGYDIGGAPTTICLAVASWSSLTATCTIQDCQNPPDLLNGVYSAPAGTEYGQNAIYSCNIGYDLDGSPITTCEDGAVWSGPPPPTCIIRDCGTLPAPANGQFNSPDGTEYGDEATYTCDDGYDIVGVTTTNCESDGDWSTTSMPTCQIRDCGALAAPENGNVDTSSGTTFGQTAAYTCNTGYDIGGVTVTTCQANGSWSTTATPSCTIRDCGALTAPVNGNVNTSTGTTYGETATYYCDVGYAKTGPDSTVCQDDGSWSTTELPICTIRDCGSLSAPTNGNVSTPNGTTYGSTTFFTCNVGYNMSGVSETLCQPDGTWVTSTIPTCELVDCGGPLAPLNGNVDTSTGTTYDETAVYTCNAGYDLIGPSSTVCLEDGTWSVTSTPNCQIKDCGALTAPVNGNVNTSTGTTYGETATYYCDVGYAKTGPDSTVCQDDGSWSNTELPICTIKNCGVPMPPSFGSVSTAEGTRFGGTATYACILGYYVISNVSLSSCQSDGAWSTPVPNCAIQDCGTLANPTNGAVSFPRGTTYNEEAVYTCDVGYSISATTQRSCLASGTWSTDVPFCTIKVCPAVTAPFRGTVDDSSGITHGSSVSYTCVPGYTLNGPATVTCHDGAWASTPPVCDLNVCPTLEAPTNGAVTLVEATGGYTCDSGFNLIGSSSTLCEGDSTWSNPAPICELACPALTSPQDGDVSISAAIATYTCHSGFSVSDATNWVCQDSGDWSLTVVPTCSLVCQALVNPSNGQVWMSGAVGNFTCNSGFLLNGAASLTCQQNGDWTDPSPTCDLACLLHTAPTHGGVTMSEDTATFSCNSGFVLSGPAALVCSTEGSWSGSAPFCIFACGTLNDPDNGQVIIGTDATTFTCNSGFVLNGSSTITCGSDGAWSNTIPTCDLACAAQVAPSNGHVTMTAAIANFTCIGGYLVNGSDTSVCADDGTWSDPTPICSLECTAIFAPLYGSMTISGATFSFACNVGFLLSGAVSIACQAGGTWTGTVPTCFANTQFNSICAQDAACVTANAVCRSEQGGTTKCLCAASGSYHNEAADSCPADCGTLPAIANGGVRTDGGTVEGQTANYQCNTGYTLIGSSARLCQNTSEWSEAEPSCVIGCSMPFQPTNGHVDTSNGFDSGKQTFYNCSTGYYLVGVDTRTCLSSGLWSDETPQCLIECPSLGSPPHGIVDLASGKYHGQSAKYMCEAGYALLGSPTRTCQVSGLWDGAEPVCIFAIVPDAMIVFAVLCIALVLIDILIVICFVYYKCIKKQKIDKIGEPDDTEPMRGKSPQQVKEAKDPEKSALEADFNYEQGDQHPPPDLHNNTPSKLSFKGKVAKVGPEKPPAKLPAFIRNGFLQSGKPNEEDLLKRDPNSKSLPSLNKVGEKPFANQRKPPVPRQPRRSLKTPTRELPRFQNDTIPFVPLETSNPPPATTYQSHTDDKKEEILRTGGVTPVEVPQKITDDEDDNPDIENVSLGHLTNPVFDETETEDDFTDTETSRPAQAVLEDASNTFKGRLSIPGMQDQDQAAGRMQQGMQDDTRHRLRGTVHTYLPTTKQSP